MIGRAALDTSATPMEEMLEARRLIQIAQYKSTGAVARATAEQHMAASHKVSLRMASAQSVQDNDEQFEVYAANNKSLRAIAQSLDDIQSTWHAAKSWGDTGLNMPTPSAQSVQ